MSSFDPLDDAIFGNEDLSTPQPMSEVIPHDEPYYFPLHEGYDNLPFPPFPGKLENTSPENTSPENTSPEVETTNCNLPISGPCSYNEVIDYNNRIEVSGDPVYSYGSACNTPDPTQFTTYCNPDIYPHYTQNFTPSSTYLYPNITPNFPPVSTYFSPLSTPKSSPNSSPNPSSIAITPIINSPPPIEIPNLVPEPPKKKLRICSEIPPTEQACKDPLPPPPHCYPSQVAINPPFTLNPPPFAFHPPGALTTFTNTNVESLLNSDPHPAPPPSHETCTVSQDQLVSPSVPLPDGKRRSSVNSNKRGKKHYQGSIDDDLEKAIREQCSQRTGVWVYPHQYNLLKRKYLVIDEDVFFKWILTQRPGYTIEKASLFEKLNKSRTCNRVNPKEKVGKMKIKYLRIDTNPQEFGSIVQTEIDTVRKLEVHKNSRIRIYTHRDWDYIEETHFYYTAGTKKT